MFILEFYFQFIIYISKPFNTTIFTSCNHTACFNDFRFTTT